MPWTAPDSGIMSQTVPDSFGHSDPSSTCQTQGQYLVLHMIPHAAPDMLKHDDLTPLGMMLLEAPATLEHDALGIIPHDKYEELDTFMHLLPPMAMLTYATPELLRYDAACSTDFGYDDPCSTWRPQA